MIKAVVINFILGIGILFSVGANAQAQAIDSMINIYGQRFPQEKIHVHFDKSYYNPGETIWFKAYLLSGVLLSDISRNIYAELIDDAGNVLQRKVMPVIGSSSFSSFDIPANYAKQLLHFRAYTAWMLNFDPAFLYEKEIRIITTSTTKASATANPTSLHFFPEGGDLVNGVESVLAFKANDHYGRPVNVKGYIRNKSGKKLNDFVSMHDGMGYFAFTPLKGETYTAVWKDASAKEQTTELPAAKARGTVMHLVPNETAVLFTIKKSPADSGSLKKMVILAHMNQQIAYEAKINLSATTSSISGSIPTDQMPSGILQVTLFDDAENPLQERIVFVRNNDYIFDAYVNAASKKMGKREKNVLEIEVADTLLANLSIAVTDADVNMADENEDNIYSNLLLTSEIRGYVHNPGYYFSSYADSVRRQLDLVMLTNGWRRFNWEDMAQRKLPVIKYMPEDYLTIQGSISGIDASKLPKGTALNIFVQYKDSSKHFISAPVNNEGKFVLKNLMFYDTAQLFYQFNNNKTLADRIAISLNNGFTKGQPQVDPSSFLNVPGVFVNDSTIARNKKLAEQYADLEAERKKRVKVLEEVVVKGKVKTTIDKLDELYAKGLFKGNDGYSFDLSTDPFAANAQSVFTYLQGKVAGLQISNEYSSNPTLSWRGGKPGLYLDEMQTDAQALSNMSMNNVAYIKVFRPPFMASGGANGAIAVYTKKAGGPAPVNDDFKGLAKMSLMGYSPVKEFYSPDYAVSNPTNNVKDIRTTLYWNPFLLFDKEKKKLTVSFYNNDITKKFRVIIEGINQEGKLTRVEEIIQ